MIRASTATCCSWKPCATPTRCAASRCRRRARQAGARLQARPLGGGARACGLAYRRARRRGRRRRCLPRRLRHRAGRHARRPDRGPAAAAARVPRGARRARADRRRRDDHGRRRHHGGRSAWHAAASRSSRRAPRRWRASAAATGIDVTPARLVDLTLAGARYEVMKAALDMLTTRARVRSDRGRGRLLGALPIPNSPSSRSSTAPARQSRSRPIWCRKRRKRLAALQRRRRAEFPHAGGLRRRGRRGAAAARAAHCCVMADQKTRTPPKMPDACSTSSKPMPARPPRHCARAGGRDRHRRHDTRRPCPFAYPVAVKALSAEIPHKTEAGGVVLGYAGR